ncbi:MAG: murein biosynthesis integral membrane protein MurJ [Acidobacteriota bacterium]|nr:murein biosynthesis integral membrane protein MurJ [Acidobacteriota bacterium]
MVWMSEQKQILTNSKIMAVMTSFSRVFGLLRDMLITYLLGPTSRGDVWSISFMIPNLFRRLIAEGAMSSAFVPILSELTEAEQERASREFMRAVFSLILVVSTILVTIMILLLPTIIPFLFKILKPAADMPGAARFDLMVLPTQIMFPYLVFVSLAAICQGVLNVHNRFALSAATPILLNMSVITCGYLLRNQFDSPIWGLCCGVLTGGFLQFAVQWVHLYRLGFRILPKLKFWGPRTAEAARLWFPTVFSAGIVQVNVMVGTIIAANLAAGAAISINMSSRLIELVLGVFATAVSTSVLPVLARQRSRGDTKAMNESLWNSLAVISLVSIPAAAGLILAGPSVIDLLFKRGEFNDIGVVMTYDALIFHAMMLVPVAWYRLLGQTYYAFKKVRIAVAIAAVAAVVNIVGCFFFPRLFSAGMEHAGVPLATLVSSWTLYWISRVVISRRFGLSWPKKLNGELLRIGLATLGFVPVWYPFHGSVMGPVELFLRIIASVAVYAMLVWILRVDALRRLLVRR